ncbi:MAG: hypothetical protein J0L62_03150 [Bacteroidetes bacterium]|nr:hypothetical protein [Bacteroidota bacterium]
MKYKPKVTISIFFAFLNLSILSIIYSSCSTSTLSVNRMQSFHPEKINRVGVWVNGSKTDTVKSLLANCIQLDLLAKGYTPVDLNKVAFENGDTLIPGNVSIGLLKKRSWLPEMDAVVLASVSQNPVFVTSDSYQNAVVGGVITYYKGVYTKSFKGEYDLWITNPDSLVMSGSKSDTVRVYIEQKGSEHYKIEPDWVALARQVSTIFHVLPISGKVTERPVKNKITVSFYPDKSYRTRFPDWIQRIQLRLLLANDIFETQFATSLVLGNIYEWDNSFQNGLPDVLTDLERAVPGNPKEVKLGLTVDPDLGKFWTSRDKIGLARPLGLHSVVSANPGFQGMTEWNPVEEAITIVHEIGHLSGAVHTNEFSSLMYPYSGNISFSFDSLNREIMTELVPLFHGDQSLRLKTYLRLLSEYFKNNRLDSDMVLTHATSSISVYQIQTGNYVLFSDSTTTHKKMKELISDPGFRWTVLGFMNHQTGNDRKSLFYLQRAKQAIPENKLLSKLIAQSEKRLKNQPEDGPIWDEDTLPPEKIKKVKKTSGADGKKAPNQKPKKKK